MLAAARYQRIVDLVNERGSVRVTELSQLCQVTEETIRRDLGKLESEGRLCRSFGGAHGIKRNTPEIPYKEREITNIREKGKIAEAAIQHIAPHDRIVLDASTTAWYMASKLPDIPLTVITNSLKVSLELSVKKNIQVFNTGGNMLSNSLSFIGPIAEKTVDDFHVDKAFISCKGVHLERGISESNEMQARIKKKMMQMAEEVYVLADYSKFDIQSFVSVNDWRGIHHLITDSKTSPDIIHQIRGKQVQVIQLTE
ncbi:DeoR/GlpR family DNA-binding transcription regulator [Paenibacillus nasutitermitis]|uniref:HTH-type transcriptional regulator YulB n=1 Tax=Paenibacillus nasutitermitis TaxID=1652958 RepID=A0A916ZD39_9BACL|nr:DeoR/GlpR family DNA-binding transcription regulator [Paenibacillus nasutitermitis]GGD89196.1 putative HTH-type transcriptional regulator YulB [Paenibacillus nasutitermitis]